MNLLRSLLILCAVAGINCSHLRTHTPGTKALVEKRLYVDDTFTASEVECIEGAANQWTQSTKGLAKVTVVPMSMGRDSVPKDTDVDDILMRRTTSESVIVFFIERINNGLLFGYYEPRPDHSEITLVVDRFISPQVCKTVVTHELGHAMGLHHSTDPSAMMYGGTDAISHVIGRTDLTDFCKAHGCRVESLLD